MQHKLTQKPLGHLVWTIHQAILPLVKEQPDNPTIHILKFHQFYPDGIRHKPKIWPKSSRWASGFPTYYQGSWAGKMRRAEGWDGSGGTTNDDSSR